MPKKLRVRKELKVLFLDIDGVLNSRQYDQETTYRRQAQWKLVGFLRNLALTLNVKVHRQLVPWLKDHGMTQAAGWAESRSFYYLTDLCQLDPTPCASLRMIMDQVPDLQVVISSDWRRWGDFLWKKALGKHGIDLSRIISVTPNHGEYGDGERVPIRLSSEPQRGHYIQAWLNKHHRVKTFVILDDRSDMYDLSYRLVQTNDSDGLLRSEAFKAVAMLKMPPQKKEEEQGE